MSKTEIVVLALAMATDSFIISWFSGALHKKLSVKLDAGFPLFLSVGRTLMVALGLVLGLNVSELIPDFAYLTGLSLLSVIGIKLGIEAFNFNPEEKVVLIDNRKTMALLIAAGSINTFFAGIGLGLMKSSLSVPCVTTFIAVLGLSFGGVLAGKKYGYKPTLRFAGLMPAIVIIIIGLRLLILKLM
ncbi:MAG: hypothetical protein HGA37_01050 [Lentimicrobium sp.]|nr:hypothetical protein [Lentimicrobium sp.]